MKEGEKAEVGEKAYWYQKLLLSVMTADARAFMKKKASY